MDIDLSKLQEYEEAFQRHFPGAKDFSSESYLERERKYKVELRTIFLDELSNRLGELPTSQDERLNVANDLISLFFRKLKWLENKPQNLVGWRYTEFTSKLDSTAKIEYLNKVIELLDGSDPLGQRVSQFRAFLEGIAEDVGTNHGAAMQRSITSFYLALSDPDHQVFVKSQEINRAIKELAGKRVFGETDEYEQIVDFFDSVKAALSSNGWQPRDMIDVQGFLWVKQAYDKDIVSDDKPEVVSDEAVEEKEKHVISIPLNQILYGPPGTGKTFSTINRALEILDPEFGVNNRHKRSSLKARFDELIESGRIGFVTFHQSFSYEDFVEGLRASTNEDGQIEYFVEDGVFKRICDAASARVTKGSDQSVEINGKHIWKMSLGNTLVDDSHIYDDCIQSNRILLGYGKDIDFSRAGSSAKVAKEFEKHGREVKDNDYAVQAVNTFINRIAVGDLVIVSDGNTKFRAIGEVVGEYEFLNEADRDNYRQSRKVRWHKVYSPPLPSEQVMDKTFSQMTLYELRAGSINIKKLETLLDTNTGSKAKKGRPFTKGEEIKKKHFVDKVSDELLVLIKPNGAKVPFTWEMLDELTDHVRSGRISIEDIGSSDIFDSIDTRIDKYIVNGYKHIVAAIVERLLAESVNFNKAQVVEKPTDEPWVLIIDEINRGNIANIFGELITLIEPSKRSGAEEELEAILPYSKGRFSVPANLHLIGTMNTADRSLAHIDTALRRRFEFREMAPDTNVLRRLGINLIEGIDIPLMLETMNKRIEILYDREHTLGHSFFVPLSSDPTISQLRRVFRANILPLLEEYFFEDWSRIRQVLGDSQKSDESLMFYLQSFSDSDVDELLGDESSISLSEKIFVRNEDALDLLDSYIGIYQKPTVAVDI